jgi:hypothetical protein
MMERIIDVLDRDVHWRQTKGRGVAFELHAGAAQLATLQFSGNPGSSARGECLEGCWTFERPRSWEQNASVRSCQSDLVVALIKKKTWSGRGTVEFANGLIVDASSNLWQTEFDLKTVDGEALIRLNVRGFVRVAGSVEVSALAASMTELPLLVLSGWYVAATSFMDASAASAVAVVG